MNKNSSASKDKSMMAVFCRDIAARYQLSSADYAAVHRWSVSERAHFWKEVLVYGKLIYYGEFTAAYRGERFFETEWLPGIMLNYAENMLAALPAGQEIICSVKEDGAVLSYTSEQLTDAVKRTAALYRRLGVKSGDRIAAVVPNADIPVVCFLAAAAIGAVWASASPDQGSEGITDRFAQIEPVLLISIDGYSYNGKEYCIREKMQKVRQQLPTVRYHIEFEFSGNSTFPCPADTFLKGFFVLPPADKIEFVPVPFAHPLYILFSSGTTGLPKCIVHGHGGVLLAHTSELMLHADMRPSDRLFFYTTCGWMMWNWMVSALGRGACLICYDGSPGFGHSHYFWKLAARLKATHVGMGAKYVSVCAQSPSAIEMFEGLRMAFTTGSPLTEDLFDYLHQLTGGKVQIASESGGTDIVGCFVGGNPLLPVHRGEIQCKILGMDIHACNDAGESVCDERGELVCRSPFPNVPVCFWNDPDHQKYRSAYFEVYPDVWAHGDLISISSKTGGIVIYGRSDTTLNPGGVRIGPAEIYRHAETVPGVKESIVVGRQAGSDEEVLLFVVLSADADFAQVQAQIKSVLRSRATPRHVPAAIYRVKDVPKTLNGKKMEKAVKNIFAGKPNNNLSAMANPECLAEYEAISRSLSS